MRNTTQKIISAVLLVLLSLPVSSVSAATNKEAFLSSLESLRATIVTSVAEREKTLSDHAATVGTQYDAALRTQGYSLDEIDALTRIPKLSAPNLRKEVTDAYAKSKTDIFSDIRSVDSGLLALRDEVSLGYGDLSNAQKASYDAKLKEYEVRYNAFLTGSTASINAFVATFSGRLATAISDVSRMMKDHVEYIRFIASVRSEFANLDAAKTRFTGAQSTFDTVTLPRLQGEITALSTDKKMATNLVRSHLEEGLSKAVAKQDRLAKQEGDLRAYLDGIMNRWNEYLKNNFAQDEAFLLQSLESKNLVTSDGVLRARAYESNGDLRTLDVTKDSDILSLAKKLTSDYDRSTLALQSLNAQYASGSTLSTIRTAFRDAQEKKIKEYETEFQTFLETRLNTALLAETNHAQNLTLIDTEEKLLKNQLSLVTSAEYSKKLVDAFVSKLSSIASRDTAEDIVKKTKNLKYKYDRSVLQKRIEETSAFSALYSTRTKLDTSMSAFIEAYASKQSDAESARAKLTQIADRIDTLSANTKLSAKKQYQLLVLRANILKYLEDATK